MKNIKYIFKIIFLVLFFSALGFADENRNFESKCLYSSPALAAKTQMILNVQSEAKFDSRSMQDISQTAANSDKYKEKGKALFRSLIIPGAGERYVGKKSLGKAFLISEVTLWVGYFAFKEYGDWIRKDALSFAATHSGAQIKNKPSQFFVDIGNYIDVGQYNDAKQRLRQFDKVYTGEDYYWAWDTDGNRHEFEQMRIASDQAKNRAVFVLGGVFANHILSAIDAVWQTYRHNKNLDQKKSNQLKLNINSSYQTGEIRLSLQKLF